MTILLFTPRLDSVAIYFRYFFLYVSSLLVAWKVNPGPTDSLPLPGVCLGSACTPWGFLFWLRRRSCLSRLLSRDPSECPFSPFHSLFLLIHNTTPIPRNRYFSPPISHHGLRATLSTLFTLPRLKASDLSYPRSGVLAKPRSFINVSLRFGRKAERPSTSNMLFPMILVHSSLVLGMNC